MQVFFRQNKPALAVVLFVILFSIIHLIKPGFIYGPDGEIRPFGIGYRHKTVVPLWLVAILLAIFSYMFVLWYV